MSDLNTFVSLILQPMTDHSLEMINSGAALKKNLNFNKAYGNDI